MSNNVAVSVTADVADLTAKMAVAKATMQDVGKEMRQVARDVAAGDTTAETKTRLLQVSEAYAKASNEAALYARQSRTTAVAVNDNTDQMRAGMQNLGFQLQDVAVQFASGQRAGTIFAQQLPQISGALTQIAQAGGNATGLLGRFASFMSGPWGVAVGVGTAVLAPFIARLFETGQAADAAKEKVYGLQQALADLRTKPMQALGELQKNVFSSESKLRAAEAMPRYTGGGSEEYKRNTRLEQLRSKAIADAQQDVDEARSALEIAKATAKTNESLFSIQSSAGRLKAVNLKDSDGASSGGSARSAGRAAASAYRAGFDEELRALQSTTDKLEATVFRPLADRTKEGLQRRDDNAAKYLQERLSVVRQANAAELAETRRFEEQKRAIQERSVAPFAQSIARMLTLQRGFTATLRDLWGSLTGIVEQAVARMVQTFLIGLLTQEVASERQHAKQVMRDAKQAAAGAWKAVVGIPIVGPILAPIAAAAAFAGVMAFASAEDGWDVPGGGGAGIDGRGGRPAIIHPREMVLPANIADTVRALPSGLAGATSLTASLRGASASVADIDAGGLAMPRIGTSGRQAGSRRMRSGSGGGTTNVTIRAMDARSFERFAKNNPVAFGKAVKHYARNGGR